MHNSAAYMKSSVFPGAFNIAKRSHLQLLVCALCLFPVAPLARDMRASETGTAATLIFAEFKIPLSTMSHLAYVEGFSKEQGLNLRPISVESGPDVIASLKSSSETAAQTANLAVEPIAAMIAAGSEPVVIATTISSAKYVKLLTFNSTGITGDPATLKGKRIGVVLDTIGETYLDRLLKLGGLQRSDILLVNSRPSEIRAALIRGDIDAGILWAPFVEQAARVYKQRVASGAASDRGELVILVNPQVLTIYVNLITTRKYLATSRPLLVALLRSLIDAETYIAEDPNRAKRTTEDWLGLEQGDLNDFFSTAAFKVSLDPVVLKQELLGVLQHLKDRDISVRTPTDLAPFIDTSLLEEIDPKLVLRN